MNLDGEVDPSVGPATSTGKARFPIGTANLIFGLVVVVGVAAVIRFLPLAASPYPLNDGGLFAHMAKDLAANGFMLPQFTTYNGEAIPFAYPPLGVYATAFLAQFSGGDATGVLRWLPAALSTASVLAVYAMSAELLRSRWRGLTAAAAYAGMPHSYVWLIVGGGVTRALGLLLALLALHQGILMLRRHRTINVITTGLLGGLTALAHPQAAVFLTASLVALLAFHMYRGRAATPMRQLIAAGAVGIVVASPWWLAVVADHGLSVLLSAGRTGFDPGVGLGLLLGLSFADSPVLDLLTALGVLGIILRIARRQWMIPTWLFLTVIIDPRAGATYATIPLALSVVPVIGELISRMLPVQGISTSIESSTVGTLTRRHPASAILIVLVLFVTLRTASRTAISEVTPLHGLQTDHLTAMAWVQQNSKADAVFAVLTDLIWESDYVSEWFPALTQRRSVATVQGSEWLGFQAFLDRVAEYHQLQNCTERTASCLDDWVSRWNQPSVYLFLPKGRLSGPRSPSDCCPALRETLVSSPRYVVIYDGPGATVFAPTGATTKSGE